jgi:cytochrome c5
MCRISCLIGFFSLVSFVATAASHNPQQILDSIRGKADEGQQIVRLFCSNCHAEKPLIELGAPKTGQLSDWKPRMKQGLDTLFQHTADGFGAMPARGGCFECSDEQLRLAIIAMLPEQLTKPIKKTES